MKNILSAREMTLKDIDSLTDYWMSCDRAYLKSLGADIDKMPSRSDFNHMLTEQINLPYDEKKSYALIWEIDNTPIGHTNVNNIEFGNRAYMHLHIWNIDNRLRGCGAELIKRSLPYYFEQLQLKELYCEPYALNLAPNKTLKKIGFEFIKKYITIPGTINFEQEVNQWRLSRNQFTEIVTNEFR